MRGWTFFFLLVFSALLADDAFALKISPFKASMTDNNAVFRIENNSPEPVAVQVSVMTWEVSGDGTETNRDAEEDFIVFPPQLVLNPHESRAVRVQYLGKTEGVEKAYRLVAEQLPVHLHDTPAAGSFPLVLGLNQENSHSFYWTINASPVVTAGASRFQDTTLQLRLYSGLILGATVLEDTKTITFRAKAESSIDLSLVNTGGAFNIADTTQTVDFGTLASGESLEYDTMIRSNDGYVVTLQSQNSQQLKHAVLPAGLVPYSLTVNGGNVNLSGGNAVQAATATGATPATGNRLPTIFTIGTLTGAEPAGNYQDVITVTVSSH